MSQLTPDLNVFRPASYPLSSQKPWIFTKYWGNGLWCHFQIVVPWLSLVTVFLFYFINTNNITSIEWWLRYDVKYTIVPIGRGLYPQFAFSLSLYLSLFVSLSFPPVRRNGLNQKHVFMFALHSSSKQNVPIIPPWCNKYGPYLKYATAVRFVFIG